MFGDMMADVSNRNNEVLGMVVNRLCGCGVPLKFKFNNGLVLGFAQGRQVSFKDWGNTAIERLCLVIFVIYKMLSILRQT